MEKREDGTIVMPEQELKDVISETVNATKEALVKEFNLDKPQGPTILVDVNPRGNDVKHFEKTFQYFKALANKDHVSMKALTDGQNVTGADADGGFVVPVEFSQEVIKVMESYGFARRYSTVHRMTGLTKNLNTLTGKVTPYWVAEGAAITASKAQFGRPVLTAKKLGGLTQWSSEWAEDNTISGIQLLAALFAEAFAGEEDNQFFNGDGTVFTGILKSACTDTTLDGLVTSLTYDKIVDCTLSLSPGQLLGATPVWLMHRTVFAAFAKVKDANLNPITVDPRGALPGTILGYPVELSEKMPAASAVVAGDRFAIFGNPKPWVHFGDRRTMTSKILSEATIGGNNLGTMDEEALRVTERVALVVAIAANIATLKAA